MPKLQYTKWKNAVSLLGSLAFASSAAAALIVTTDHQENASLFTPTWTVATPRLHLTLLSSDGNFQMESAGGLSTLTDGVLGASGSVTGFATVGGNIGAGHVVTYTLDSAAYGYDITNVTVYCGWNDNGRDGVFFNVSYATVANPTSFISCGYAAYNPTASGKSANKVMLTDSLGAPIAANVAALRFDFSVQGAGDNGYSGCSEITVQGAASTSVKTPPLVITMNNQYNAAQFTPTWTVESGNLIGGKSPIISSGTFTYEAGTTGPGSLTDGALAASGNQAGFSSLGGAYATANPVIYELVTPYGGTGMDLTNIVVYSGWGGSTAGSGRDGQFYNVLYSTVSDPTTFIPLTSVEYNPAVPGNVANRVAITTSTGAPLAVNVCRVKFDFSPQTTSVDNGWSGYDELIIQGLGSTNTPPPIAPFLTADTLPTSVQTFVGDSTTFSAGFSNFPACTYQWQVVKAAGTNDISGATSTILTLTNLLVSDSGSYRLKAFNAADHAGIAYSTDSSLIVTSPSTAGNGVTIGCSVQTGFGYSDPFFSPTWTAMANNLLRFPSFYDDTNKFGLEGCSSNLNSLTDGAVGPLHSIVDHGAWTNLCTMGNSGGTYVVYTLPDMVNGYDLTNIAVYGGWGDNGRDAQQFEVLYSTVLAPDTFIHLATVSYNPEITLHKQSAVRVKLTPVYSALAGHVAKVKFNYAGSVENGYVGVSEFVVNGLVSSLSATPFLVSDIQPTSPEAFGGDSITFTAGFSNSPALNYQWQVIKGAVITDIPGATSSTLTLTNLQVSDAGSYQLKAVNATNSAAVAYSSASSLTVISTSLTGTTLENFESYPSSTELAAAWTSVAGTPTLGMETNNVCEGAHALALTYSGTMAPFTNLVKLTLAANQDWSTNTLFVFNYGGASTNSADDLVVQLLDQNGIVLKTQIIAGGTASSPCSIGSVDISAAFSAVRAIQLGVIASAADHTGTVYFDNLFICNRGVLSVLGSSVAKGYGSTGSVANQSINGSFLNGYAARLTAAQGSKGWRVVNQSVGGDSTGLVIGRFNNDEVPVHADEVLIGLSLGNEGLPGSANPQAICTQYYTGITNLIAMCRAIHSVPLVCNNYPRAPYTANEYLLLKNMDLQMNALNVPSVNFLGATDDGAGHWVNNSFINLDSGDGVHPTDAGHNEMFLTIVPSVFDAVKARKSMPQWGNKARFLRLTGNSAQAAPLSFTPGSTIHSFSVSFRVRSTATGTVASITLPNSSVHPTVEITKTGIAYLGTNGVVSNSGVAGTNGIWHDIVVAHQYARGQTLFYVDGSLASTVSERLTPVGFVLGGQGSAATRPGSPVQADYQNWFVHRSLLVPEAVTAQLQGKLQQASLEIYAALDDSTFVSGGIATNRAQSLSLATINGVSENYASILALAPSNLIVTSNDTPAVVLNWTDPASAAEDSYLVERSVAGGAWTSLATLSAHATTYTDSTVGFGINYQYRVSFSQAGLFSDSLTSATVFIPFDPRFNEFTSWMSHFYPTRQPVVLVDFDAGTPNYNGQHWNTISNATDTTVSYPLMDSNGLYTGFTAQLTGAFNGTATDTAGLGIYSADAERSMFVGNSTAPSTVKFSGLKTNYGYRFTFLARRVATVTGYYYSGLYTVAGASSNSVVVNAANNSAYSIISGVIPDSTGSISLSVSPSTGTGTPNPMLNMVAIMAMPIATVPGVVAIDFDDQVNPVYGSQVWNTIPSPSDTTTIYKLADINGWQSGYSAQLTGSFDQTRTDTAVGLFPTSAETSLFALRDKVGRTGQITFSNLNTAASYDFTFLAHRPTVVAGYDYSGKYIFSGAATNSIIVSTATNFTGTVMQGIIPSAAGVITLTVTTNPVPLPGTSPFVSINLVQMATVFGTARTNVFIDFNPGTTTVSPDSKGRYWNTVATGTTGTTYSNLKNQYNVGSGVSLKLVNGFNSNRNNNNGSFTNGEYPSTSELTLLVADYGAAGAVNPQLLISGLIPGQPYDFKFFTSRSLAVSGYNYANNFVFTGIATNTVLVNGGNNTSLSWVPRIVPSAAGTITLDIIPANVTGTKFALINTLQFAPSQPAIVNQLPADPKAQLDDPDSDGANNYAEYISNTSPTNAGTRFDLANVTVASNGAAGVTWTSAQDGGGYARLYDVYKTDRSEGGFGPWTLLASGVSPSGVTTTLQDDASSVTQRLYRVVISGLPFSATVRSTRIAGVQAIPVNVGRQFLACSLVPPANTLSGIFGGSLPSGTVQSSSATVDLWDQVNQGLSKRYWFSSAPGFEGWRRLNFADATADSLDANKGFILTLRDGAAPRKVYLAGWLAQTNQIQSVSSNGWTLAGSSFPVNVALADSGLLASGFIGGADLASSDKVAFFNPQTQHVDTTNWFDTVNSVWRDQSGSTATNQLQPGAAFLIYRNNRASDMNWTNNTPSTVQTLLQ